ncbi:hypothetical protein [Mycobacteroides abscessus]|uniref:hypothetical protein n=1 Tax=Mycobacteroides abscessus TaxID=36809 RepID=UPI001877DA5D|nr:hypothetical protein [Mycobacteroides abscessus]
MALSAGRPSRNQPTATINDLTGAQVKMTVTIPKDLHHAIKVYAATHATTVRELVIAGIQHELGESTV